MQHAGIYRMLHVWSGFKRESNVELTVYSGIIPAPLGVWDYNS